MTRYVQYIPVSLSALSCVTVLPLLALLSAPLQDGRPRVIVGPPGLDLEQIVDASGGWVVGVSRAPLAVMAVSESTDFEQRLRDNGAWAILDGDTLAWLCGVTI